MATQVTSVNKRPATRRVVPSVRDDCRCSAPKPIPDLTAFLTLLAPHHLEDLVRQCGLTPSRKGEDPARLAQQIARSIEENPDKPIRLRNKPKRLSKRARSAYRFKEREQYLLGQFGSSIWDVGVKEFGGQPRRQLSLRVDLPFLLEIDFHLVCAIANHLFGMRLVIEDDVVIPDGVTLVTDLQSIRFEGQLSMGRDARLYGAHPCGLRLEVDHLSGIGGIPGTPAMAQWPMISTSIRPLNEQNLGTELVNPDYPNLWRITAGSVRVDGDLGRSAASSHPERRGAKGADGRCDWGGLGGHTHAEDGQPQEGVQGLPGVAGEDGGNGHSAAPLTVMIQSTYDGHLRFEARGGDGGKGGDGGRGQGLVSGAGGDLSRWCAGVTKPGLGGAQGVGGDAGRGGAGGNGGNGGTIHLSLPNATDERLYRACVRKGSGGRAGNHGAAGVAYRGNPGRWLDLFTGEPDSFLEVPEDYWQTVAGSVPPPSLPGQDGWNGSIYVNGELKVATNQNNTPSDFRYPPGTVTAGGGNDCWD